MHLITYKLHLQELLDIIYACSLCRLPVLSFRSMSASEKGPLTGIWDDKTASSFSAPDICHGEGQSEGPGKDWWGLWSVSMESVCSSSVSPSIPVAGTMATDNLDASNELLDGVTSSTGSKIKGRSSEDMVASVPTSCNKGKTVASSTVSTKVKKIRKMHFIFHIKEAW